MLLKPIYSAYFHFAVCFTLPLLQQSEIGLSSG